MPPLKMLLVQHAHRLAQPVVWLCREVQRILMELLNQMDGFDQTVNVKVIMATNRADTLDPALLRPGRLDRKIEFPLPDRRQKRLVFQV